MSSTILNVDPTYFDVLFLGDMNVGKTSLIQNLAGVPYDPKNVSSIGSEYLLINMTLGRSSQKILAGVRLYDSHFTLFNSPHSLSRKKDIIVIVWSLSDAESFRNMKRHMEELSTLYGESDQVLARPDIIVCANKSDVSKLDSEFKDFQKRDFKMIRTSALDNTGIQELMKCIEDLLFTRHYGGQHILRESIELSRDDLLSPGPRPDPSCC